ncbi:MAG TPA: hypothetical protein VI251_15945 [Pseudolabrys sp.]|jgi:hypothetical protein
MRTTDRVVRRLIAEGHLKTVTVVNPVNRCPTVIVPAGEVARFQRKYVSLFALAKRMGKHIRAVKTELEVPAWSPRSIPRR